MQVGHMSEIFTSERLEEIEGRIVADRTLRSTAFVETEVTER